MRHRSLVDWFGRFDVGGYMDKEASPTSSVQDVSSVHDGLRNRPERRERTASWRTGIENQATRVQIAVDEIRSENRGCTNEPESRTPQ
jgi:hypothetical protein